MKYEHLLLSEKRLMLKLKLQYFGHLMWRADSLKKTLMLGGIVGKRRRGLQRGLHHWLDARESEWTPGVGDGQGGLECCSSWGRKGLDMTEQPNWTELILRGVSWHPIMTLVCIFLISQIISHTESPFMSILALCVFFGEMCFQVLCLFLNQVVWFYVVFIIEF